MAGRELISRIWYDEEMRSASVRISCQSSGGVGVLVTRARITATCISGQRAAIRGWMMISGFIIDESCKNMYKIRVLLCKNQVKG